MMGRIGIVIELSKVRIACLATASAAAGFVLAAHGVSAVMVPALLGVFLLASGAGALNQAQEGDIDALMRRTMNRPVPSHRIRAREGFVVAIALLAAGSALLYAASPVAMLLGFVTVLWYNAIYTPLKRVTAFAAIPGGVVGAIPPVIGWVAGGGSAVDPRILAVAYFFFVWQVPHFWLLLMRIGDDYDRAGLPTLTRMFTRAQFARIIYVWMITTMVACVSMPLFGVSSQPWIQAGLILSSLWLGWHATRMVWTNGRMLAFHQINLYALVVISLLSISGLAG
ncbi:MAG TPA: protoheme IX farnesyltransferase [Candidatus Krumholzibacteria bacterium]